VANPNLDLFRSVVFELGELADEFVFVGGCTVGLFITDEGSEYIRPTQDVDGIVEVSTYSQYVDFGNRLRQLGFRSDGPTCRWMKHDMILDVLPIDEKILGFRNKWYKDAVDACETRAISVDKNVRVVSPAYFIATKLEAFLDRGKNDFLSSHDLEDVITVVNGREELIDELRNSPADVRSYVGELIASLLNDQDFMDSLPGHLNPDVGRVSLVISRLEGIAKFRA
jgi:hypothetical protein